MRIEYLSYREALVYGISGWYMSLPEWEGYWYIEKDANGENIIKVHTKEGLTLHTPHVKYMLRKDWIVTLNV